MMRFELLEWRDRRYQHVQYLRGTKEEASAVTRKLNEGYTGPRFILKPKECGPAWSSSR